LVGARLADRDLSSALQWIGQLDGAVQSAAMRGVVSQWAAADPSAAAGWLMQQNSPHLRQEGLRLLAEDWVGRNPAAAIEGAGDRHLAHARDGGELAQG
jgi:hypothetical protein